MERLPSYENCFFCGPRANGLHLRVEYAAGVCSCGFEADGSFQGFRGALHGGIVSGILDEIMWWAVFVETGVICATWKMDVEFRRAVLCGKAYRAVGRYEDVRHGNYRVSASIEDESGAICAKAVGTFRKAGNTNSEDFFRELNFSESSKEVKSLLRSRLLNSGQESGTKADPSQ